MILNLFKVQFYRKYKNEVIMDIKIILALINGLKTLRNIIIKYNEAVKEYEDIRSISIMNRLVYQQERFDKITKDIKLLMKRVVTKEEFKLYLLDFKKMSNELSMKEKSLNKQAENTIIDIHLHLKDLNKKMVEFEVNLNKLSDSLKDDN